MQLKYLNLLKYPKLLGRYPSKSEGACNGYQNHTTREQIVTMLNKDPLVKLYISHQKHFLRILSKNVSQSEFQKTVENELEQINAKTINMFTNSSHSGKHRQAEKEYWEKLASEFSHYSHEKKSMLAYAITQIMTKKV